MNMRLGAPFGDGRQQKTLTTFFLTQRAQRKRRAAENRDLEFSFETRFRDRGSIVVFDVTSSYVVLCGSAFLRVLCVKNGPWRKRISAPQAPARDQSAFRSVPPPHVEIRNSAQHCSSDCRSQHLHRASTLCHSENRLREFRRIRTPA